MAMWYSEYCPNCGKTIYYDNKPRLKSFGNSQVKCDKCKKIFIDPKVFEWENLTLYEKKYVLVTEGKYNIMEYDQLIKEIQRENIVRFINPFLFKEVALLKKIKEQLDYFVFEEGMLEMPEIKASIERTSDPEYRLALYKLGRSFNGVGYDGK